MFDKLTQLLLGRTEPKQIHGGTPVDEHRVYKEDINLPLEGDKYKDLIYRRMLQKQFARPVAPKAPAEAPGMLDRARDFKRKVNPFDRIADVLDKAGGGR